MLFRHYIKAEHFNWCGSTFFSIIEQLRVLRTIVHIMKLGNGPSQSHIKFGVKTAEREKKMHCSYLRCLDITALYSVSFGSVFSLNMHLVTSTQYHILEGFRAAGQNKQASVPLTLSEPSCGLQRR